ncbi:hypothetical protein SAMN05421780_101540 [Flexibacter flexilis DSM 6793]|uniref:Phage protein D n=1 Tax=Flexibacter flexilis DSM 6793 TaxID=927664 RepID=A0A1I1E4H3_9BACT|nr:hypothetical protein [Flexibacter flexilis]SFB80108.1 hypothetical protein SAMN05421780_101540 [Flexibacter flexilis DSM 6793]
MQIRVVFGETSTRNEFELRTINHFSCKKSWKDLVGTGTLKIASRSYFHDQDYDLKDLIKVGDPVTVYAGYDNELVQEFIGFVATVKPTIPIEILLEDYMYKLKHTAAHCIFSSCTLAQLLAKIIPKGIAYSAASISLGAFKATNTNVASCLAKLKESHGLSAYFIGKKLYVGLVHLARVEQNLTPIYTVNIPQGVRKHSLEFKAVDDVKVKVTVTSGKGVKAVVGDEGGETISMRIPKITQSEAERYANERLKKVKVAGFKGSVDLWGLPYIEHGEIVTIIDRDYPDKKGNYYVDAVNFAWDSGGIVRTLEIGAATK